VRAGGGEGGRWCGGIIIAGLSSARGRWGDPGRVCNGERAREKEGCNV
jgi:hypothetical protein